MKGYAMLGDVALRADNVRSVDRHALTCAKITMMDGAEVRTAIDLDRAVRLIDAARLKPPPCLGVLAYMQIGGMRVFTQTSNGKLYEYRCMSCGAEGVNNGRDLQCRERPDTGATVRQGGEE